MPSFRTVRRLLGGSDSGPAASGGPLPAPPAPAGPQPRFVPAPSAPAPAFAAGPGFTGPSGGRAAPRELTPLRSTTVASLTAERAVPEPVAPAAPAEQTGERRWGSPAAPGSATHVLPQRGRGRRRTVPAQATPSRAVPMPAAPAQAEPPQAEPAQDASAAPPASPIPVADPAPALQAPTVHAPTVQAPAVQAPAPRPAPTKVDLTPRPGDPVVGAALLAPARARLHELEPPLVRSWLTLLDAGQRGEAAPVLKAGQLAVLAAGLEDAAVRRRLLRAVADPFVDAVGLVTQDVPLDGLSAACAPAGRVGAARDLLLLVARTTTGTPAQGAAVRAVKWLDRPAG